MERENRQWNVRNLLQQFPRSLLGIYAWNFKPSSPPELPGTVITMQLYNGVHTIIVCIL